METPCGSVTISQFLRSSGPTLLRLNAECSPIALTRNGRSVAVLVDVDTYAGLLEALRQRPDAG